MSQIKEATQLFEMFSPISTEAWKEKITTDLKGADYTKKLVWRTQEGFNVEPFYREEDLESLKYILDCNPGEYPFLRGNKFDSNDWLIRQDIDVTNMKIANQKALEVLGKGVESIGFIFAEDLSFTLSDLEILLSDISLEAIEICFVSPHGAENLVNLFNDYAKTHYEGKDLKVSFDFDPVGHFALYGKFCSDEKEMFDKARALVYKMENNPSSQVITIHSNYFKDAGVNSIQELAVTLAMGNEYLTHLTDLGVDAHLVNSKIRFNFGVDVNYFMEIAKFRAARFLWAKIVEKYGVEKQHCRMHIHAQTSTWGMSVYDPYVNTLRTTTAGMSATLGGVESMTINPFNFYEEATPQAERIARNQQIILKEESYFKSIVDPAGGSYYIENLTDKLIQETWKLFLELENEGGFIASYRKGNFQKKLEQTVAERSKNIALRKETFLGTNDFPNFSETKENMPAHLFESTDNTVENAETQGLITYRGPQEFERMRYRTDRWAIENKRPVVFMLTYGNLAMRLARSQFSQNFFSIGGFETIDNHGFETIQDGVTAALEKDADIVVLCSADDEYPIIAPEALKLLEGKADVVVAGYPKKTMEELQNAGIKHFIHVRSNVLETLESFQRQLGLLK